MTADIVTEARQLLNAATPGPWRHTGYCTVITENDPARTVAVTSYSSATADAAFIAAAPRLVTDLLAEVERLRDAVVAHQHCCSTGFWPELRDGGDQ